MPDEKGYPTDEELQRVLEWDCNDPMKLIFFLEDIWWNAYPLIKLKGKRVIHVELHTGGWSGNEDIIKVLRETMFWLMYWQQTKRGGHYYFKFPFPKGTIVEKER